MSPLLCMGIGMSCFVCALLAIGRRELDEMVETVRRIMAEAYALGRQAAAKASGTEPVWEPPGTGYTKKDGKLVLVTGKVIEDPLNELSEEEKKKREMASRCIWPDGRSVGSCGMNLLCESSSSSGCDLVLSCSMT